MSSIAEKIKKMKGIFGAKKKKSFEEVSSEFSVLRKQVYEELSSENKWQLDERSAAYEKGLASFVKENPKISDNLLKEDFSKDDSFALIRGMVGAMNENPELSSVFIPIMSKWAGKQYEASWYLVAGLDEFVKSNPNKAKDMLPLLEVISNNPPKSYNQKSTKEADGALAWEARENTKDYFLLAEAVVTVQPALADKVDTMVGKFKKQVSILDAISVDGKANGGKISERTPKDWTYYHDRYMKAHVEAKKNNMKKMAAFKQQGSHNI